MVARRPARSVAGTATGDPTKSQRTRARILDATARVLSEKGYAGTRLTDVAEYAELQAPAIYYYFASRDEIIEEVMFSGISEMRLHLQEELDRLPDGMSPMDRIIAAVEIHLRHELELSDYATASIRNSGQIPDHLRSRQKKESTAYNRIWRKLLADARAEGQLRDDLDDQIAQALVLGALNWAAEWWDPRRISLDAIVANAQVVVRNGLSPRSGSNSPRSRGKATRRTPGSASR